MPCAEGDCLSLHGKALVRRAAGDGDRISSALADDDLAGAGDVCEEFVKLFLDGVMRQLKGAVDDYFALDREVCT